MEKFLILNLNYWRKNEIKIKRPEIVKRSAKLCNRKDGKKCRGTKKIPSKKKEKNIDDKKVVDIFFKKSYNQVN